MKSFYKLSEIELEKLKKETDQITIYDETENPSGRIIFSIPQNPKIAKTHKEVRIENVNGTKLYNDTITIKDFYYNKNFYIGNAEDYLYHKNFWFTSNDITMIKIHETMYSIEYIDSFVGEEIAKYQCPLRISLRPINPNSYCDEAEVYDLVGIPQWMIQPYKKDQLVIYNGSLYINGKFACYCKEVLDKCKELYPGVDIRDWYVKDLNDFYDEKIKKIAFDLTVNRTGYVPTSYYTEMASGGFSEDSISKALAMQEE